MAHNGESVKALLKKAYARLLCRTLYSEITVKELIQEAGVSRVSFYRAYGSFEEIVEDIWADLYERVTKEIFPLFLENSEMAIKRVLRGFFGKLKESNITRFPPENIQYVFGVVGNRFNVNEIVPATTVRQRYAPIVNVGVLFAVAKKWALGGFVDSEEELCEYVYRVMSAIAAD